MRRVNQICRDLGLDADLFPVPSVKDIRKRLDATLDATTRDRRHTHTRRVLVRAAVVLAVAALLSVTAWAVANSVLLGTFFQGDSSTLEGNVKKAYASVSDDNWVFTVEEVLADPYHALITLSIEARTDEAAAELNSDEFWNMDTIRFSRGDKQPIRGGSSGKTWGTERKQYTITAIELVEEGQQLWVRFDKLPDKIELPLTPDVNTLDLSLQQTVPMLRGDTGTVTRLLISPISLRLEFRRDDESAATQPFIQPMFRFEDGTLMTVGQLIPSWWGIGTGIKPGEENFYIADELFDSVLDLSQLSGVILGDTEYLVHQPGKTIPAAFPPELLPFELRLVDLGTGFRWIPLRELCEGLGADYTWDEEAQTASMTYRGVTALFTLGSRIAHTPDGQAYDFREDARVPRLEAGELLLPENGLLDDWFHVSIASSEFYLKRSPSEDIPVSWFVIP